MSGEAAATANGCRSAGCRRLAVGLGRCIVEIQRPGQKAVFLNDLGCNELKHDRKLQFIYIYIYISIYTYIHIPKKVRYSQKYWEIPLDLPMPRGHGDQTLRLPISKFVQST
jgi:hypothetical protein